MIKALDTLGFINSSSDMSTTNIYGDDELHKDNYN
jgi:hypothetical protein